MDLILTFTRKLIDLSLDASTFGRCFFFSKVKVSRLVRENGSKHPSGMLSKEFFPISKENHNNPEY